VTEGNGKDEVGQGRDRDREGVDRDLEGDRDQKDDRGLVGDQAREGTVDQYLRDVTDQGPEASGDQDHFTDENFIVTVFNGHINVVFIDNRVFRLSFLATFSSRLSVSKGSVFFSPRDTQK